MKITQEVRDFAAKQNSGADTFLAAEDPIPVRPEPVEGSFFPSSAAQKEKSGASTSSARTEEELEAGMAEMSERFREVGSEIYVGAHGREHD